MKKNTKVPGWILPLGIFIVCFVLVLFVYAKYGQYNLDSDMSSDMVLAQLLNKEGHILSTNYYYSNELNILSPILIFQVALKLFPSWHIARTFSIGVMLLLIAASLVYLGCGAGISVGASLLGAAALILPISEAHAFILIYGAFYAVWAALTFFEMGLILRMKKKRIIEPILLAVFGFLGGLSGVRMLMIFIAPVLLASVINFFLEARKAETPRDVVHVPAFLTLAGTIICTIATLIGYVISTNVLAKIYSFVEFDDTVLHEISSTMFLDQLMAIQKFFGYRSDMLVLSAEGLYSIFALILPIFGVACIIILLKMNLNSEERLLAVFMQVAILLGMTINVLTLYDPAYPYAVSYYIPAALLLIFAIFWMFDRIECNYRILRTVPMIACVALFLIGFNSYQDLDMNKYDDERTTIAELLLDKGVTKGYATYWYSNVLSELTDGKIEVYTVEDWETGRIGDWMQQKDHLTTEPEGPVFAVFSADDYENEIPGCDLDHLIYSSESVFVCVYDDVEDFHEARGDR